MSSKLLSAIAEMLQYRRMGLSSRYGGGEDNHLDDCPIQEQHFIESGLLTAIQSYLDPAADESDVELAIDIAQLVHSGHVEDSALIESLARKMVPLVM